MTVDARQIPITSPCPIDLDRSGIGAKDREMHCRHCRKDVHLLSHMTEAQARDLMLERAGQDICVSYAVKHDGGIRFRPDERTLVPAAALVRPRVSRRLPRLVTLGATALLAACTAHGEPEQVGPLASDDTIPVVTVPVIPDAEPCDPGGDDVMVDGGIEAAPVPEVKMMPRGRIRAQPVEPPEPEVMKAGGLRAAPLDDPLDDPSAPE